MPSKLFRVEAVQPNSSSWLGEIIIARPISHSFYSTFALTVILALGCFSYFGYYTKRTTIKGQIVPALGEINIRPSQVGIVEKRLVQEGEHVKKGEALLVISSERYAAKSAPVQEKISTELSRQQKLLISETEDLRRVQANERLSLKSEIVSLKKQLETIHKQLLNQAHLIEIALDAVKRYSGLAEKGYISLDQVQQKQVELFSQRQSLESLKRDETSIKQDLLAKENNLQTIKSRQRNEVSELERNLSRVDQELQESEARRELTLTAPEDGLVTAVIVDQGRFIETSTTLVKILPSNNLFEAELYAPSSAMGFIQPNDSTRIRYQSYPYQKFGQYSGIVSSITATSIPPNEIAAVAGGIPGLKKDGEQYYRIKVKLDNQFVTTYGIKKSLQSGMLIEADIFQERRHLYEWILEPFISLKGKY